MAATQMFKTLEAGRASSIRGFTVAAPILCLAFALAGCGAGGGVAGVGAPGTGVPRSPTRRPRRWRQTSHR